MATKKNLKSYTVTGTINNLKISTEVEADSLEEALAKGKELTYSDFIHSDDIQDYEGPEITSLWLNE